MVLDHYFSMGSMELAPIKFIVVVMVYLTYLRSFSFPYVWVKHYSYIIYCA